MLSVRFVIGFDLPLHFCLAAIAASALLNVVLRLRLPRTHRLEDVPAASLLAYDIVQLAALLYLTGGIENPFCILILAPVMISAVSLPRRFTFYLLALMIVVALLLTIAHQPLPWISGVSMSIPILYRTGIWIAICLGGSFVSIYAGRVAEEARLLADALAATELVLAREQHLTQLDGLAAAAAHELGTPLATIALVVREMIRQPDDQPHGEDLALLSQQVARCREILGKLASLGSDPAGPLEDMSLRVLIEEVVQPHRNFGIAIVVDASGHGPEPRCYRSPGILYGLGNMIENAIDFAAARVIISASWSDSWVAITIDDDGPGFSPEILNRVGEPYISTRSAEQKSATPEAGGLGLGLFIAKTLLERGGANVSVGNSDTPNGGAHLRITWRRQVFEAGRRDSIATENLLPARMALEA